MTSQEAKSFLPSLTQTTQMFAPLHREIDRVFADFGRGFAADGFALSPTMDLVETDDGVELSVEVPGLTEKDIKLSVEDDVLTISGEKRSEADETRGRRHIVERRYGAFERAVRLPRGVAADKVQAVLTNGVLKITAPMSSERRPHVVEIQPRAG